MTKLEEENSSVELNHDHKAKRIISLIDHKYKNNPQYVFDFVSDIFEHLKETEVLKIYTFF